ncbi:uncharacterized protein [Nothobranchius furzeri]|uniref:uncharacterized protein isoform X2 n=1 Tax=Nothobranchius furzeri TaxID=105023 RepID=UPI003904DCE7
MGAWFQRCSNRNSPTLSSASFPIFGLPGCDETCDTAKMAAVGTSHLASNPPPQINGQVKEQTEAHRWSSAAQQSKKTKAQRVSCTTSSCIFIRFHWTRWRGSVKHSCR